jgi:hypothetical protein
MNALLSNKRDRSSLELRVFLIALMFVWFGVLPTVQAITPVPDGGYPGNNTAEGTSALASVTTAGVDNTANGFGALFHTTTGSKNTASGFQALISNTNGFTNTADGSQALPSLTTGSQAAQNTAVGFRALLNLTTGHDDTALGWDAGADITSSNFNTNNVEIGNSALTSERETIRIGGPIQTRTFIAGINGASVTGSPVVVNAAGQLGVAPSSQRFKEEIKPMGDASEGILALKPVTFHYKKEIDPDGARQFGLVAEEVAKVNPALVTRDADGRIYSVRYDAVNAMLLNEFLKEHRNVQEHDAAIAQVTSRMAQQQRDMDTLAISLKEQVSQLKKVSSELQVTNGAQE